LSDKLYIQGFAVQRASRPFGTVKFSFSFLEVVAAPIFSKLSSKLASSDLPSPHIHPHLIASRHRHSSVQSHFMPRIIMVKILPVYRISEYRFKGNPFIERSVAIDKLTPTLIIRRSKSRKIGPSTRTICVYINKECRSDIPSDRVRIVEPVVVVAVLARDTVILYHDGHEITKTFVEGKGCCAFFDSFDGFVASV
jgi:hypothetical protein